MKKNNSIDTGLLITRLSLGLILFAHGWVKITNIDGFLNFLNTIGIPSILGYAVIAIELLGGIAIILGIWTRIVSILFAIEMVVVYFLLKKDTGFIGGYEFEFVLFMISLALSVSGPGSHSILPGKKYSK